MSAANKYDAGTETCGEMNIEVHQWQAWAGWHGGADRLDKENLSRESTLRQVKWMARWPRAGPRGGPEALKSASKRMGC